MVQTLIKTLVLAGLVIIISGCKRGTYQYGNNEDETKIEYTQSPNSNPVQPPK